MPREIAIFDALVPTLLFAFLLSAFMSWLIDAIFIRYGLYQRVWYRALFRLAIFVCIFACFGLIVYS